MYAVGDTIVCDDLDVAREICFRKRGEHHDMIKAVTVSGSVISKVGTMTGKYITTLSIFSIKNLKSSQAGWPEMILFVQVNSMIKT